MWKQFESKGNAAVDSVGGFKQAPTNVHRASNATDTQSGGGGAGDARAAHVPPISGCEDLASHSSRDFHCTPQTRLVLHLHRGLAPRARLSRLISGSFPTTRHKRTYSRCPLKTALNANTLLHHGPVINTSSCIDFYCLGFASTSLCITYIAAMSPVAMSVALESHFAPLLDALRTAPTGPGEFMHMTSVTSGTERSVLQMPKPLPTALPARSPSPDSIPSGELLFSDVIVGVGGRKPFGPCHCQTVGRRTVPRRR